MVTVLVDVIETDGCEEDGEVDVEEVGTPGCGLMLGYTCHDWDVLLCVGGVEESHRPA